MSCETKISRNYLWPRHLNFFFLSLISSVWGQVVVEHGVLDWELDHLLRLDEVSAAGIAAA